MGGLGLGLGWGGRRKGGREGGGAVEMVVMWTHDLLLP